MEFHSIQFYIDIDDFIDFSILRDSSVTRGWQPSAIWGNSGDRGLFTKLPIDHPKKSKCIQ